MLTQHGDVQEQIDELINKMFECATDNSDDAIAKRNTNNNLVDELQKLLARIDKELSDIAQVPKLNTLPPHLNRICNVQDSEDLSKDLRLCGNVHDIKKKLEKEDPEGDVRINVRSKHGIKKREADPHWNNDSPRTKKRRVTEAAKLATKRARGIDQRKLTKFEEVQLKFMTDLKEQGKESDDEDDLASLLRVALKEQGVATEDARRNQQTMLNLIAQLVPQPQQAPPAIEDEEKQEIDVPEKAAVPAPKSDLSVPNLCAVIDAVEKEVASEPEHVLDHVLSDLEKEAALAQAMKIDALLVSDSDDDLSHLELSGNDEDIDL